MKQHASEIDTAKERIEEMIESGAPVHDVLEHLVRTVESLTHSGMVGSILILDDSGRHLLHGAGPSLPNPYNEAINGIEIGPDVGSCGTAAFCDRTVAVFDIANNPLWANFKDLALQYGLRACWSTPIHSSEGKVIGTFANYYKVVRDPSPTDQALTDMITHTAAKAIEHDKARKGRSSTASLAAAR